MSFKIKNFSTIRISSTNVSKSRDWYKKLFGADPVEDIENFVSFKINGVCFDISLADSKSPSSTGGSVGYWLVDDLDQAITQAMELGGEIYRGPLKVDKTQSTIVQIKDPCRNIIGFEALF